MTQSNRFLILGFVFIIPHQSMGYDGQCRSAQDIADLPQRHWCEVPNSELRSVEKKPSEFSDWNGTNSEMYDSFQRVMGVEAVTRAWNSAAMDTKRSCLLVTGGGHNDYGGNEIYQFCLGTLTWERISDPTPFPNRHPSFQNSDGTPISRHTYGGVTYMSGADKMFMFDGAPDDGPGTCGVRGTWTFDLKAREQAAAYAPTQWRLHTSDGEPERRCDNASTYDPYTGDVLFKSPSGTYSFDFVNSSWEQVNASGRLNSQVALSIDPENRLLVEVGGGSTAFWQLDNGFTGGVVSTSGATSIQSADDPGLVYDPRAGKMVAWRGGSSVFTLDTSSRIWTEVQPATTNTANPGSASTSGGIFGRFNYSPTLNVYIYVDRVSENVYLYRLSSEDGPQTPEPPADLASN